MCRWKRKHSCAVFLAGMIVFWPLRPAVAFSHEDLSSNFVRSLLISARIFADITYRSILSDDRLGTVTVSGIEIVTAGGPVMIERMVFSSARGFGLEIKTMSVDGRVEVHGMTMDLQSDLMPPNIAVAAKAFDLRTLMADAIVEFDYTFGNSGLQLSVFLSADNFGDLNVGASVTNLHVSGDLSQSFSELTLGQPPRSRLEGRLVRLEAQFSNKGLVKRLLTFVAASENKKMAEVMTELPKTIRTILEGWLGTVDYSTGKPVLRIPPGARDFVDKTEREAEDFMKDPDGIFLSVRPRKPLGFEELRRTVREGDLDGLGLVLTATDHGRELVDVGEVERAIAAGDRAARVALGRRYLDGDGVPQNFAKAVELIPKAAESGDPKARYLLARIYAEGLGTQPDPRRAHLEASLAAAQGHERAADLLARIEARMKAEEIELAQDDAAKTWEERSGTSTIESRKRAAMAGDPAAMRALAKAYYQGLGVPRHYQRAYTWASLATAAGDRMSKGIRDRILRTMETGLITRERILAAQIRATEVWENIIGPALKRRRKEK